MRFVVKNLRPVTRRLDTKPKIEFARQRVKKVIRKRANACVNFLTQIGWLKKKSEALQVVTYEEVIVDPVQIDRWITENYYQLVRRFNMREMTLIMGPEKAHQLVRCCDLVSPIRFQLQHGSQFRGMTIIILPWMDGVMFVPKEYLPTIERKVEVKVPMSPQEFEDHRRHVEGDRAAALWRMENP